MYQNGMMIAADKVRYQTLLNNADALKNLFTPDALKFLQELHGNFEVDRRLLLERRTRIAEDFKVGHLPSINVPPQEDWRVVEAPHDLKRRHVEITGPCEAKMMINALNSGADVFMADIEDSLSPTWPNIVNAQVNLQRAVTKRLNFESQDGKTYSLTSQTATLLVRPRGWHLLERNFLIDGQPISASLFDFGLYFFHCAKELIRRNTGPYFYLPKSESALEAKLWNSVFNFSQDALGIPRGTIRATVLIETIPAAFEMDQILYELREHASGLNAGRWDYLFSFLKKFPEMDPPFPDRSMLTMDLPFLNAYCRRLVNACHCHGAHAIGGMSAFIPSRRDESVNKIALQKVRADKQRELELGFDGTWVAHPDLVPFVKNLFLEKLGENEDQKRKIPEDIADAAELMPRNVPGKITEQGARTNISVALTYLNSWLDGQGAVSINNLMEDAATAEISRAQLWQWVRRKVPVKEGLHFDESVFRDFLAEEILKIRPKISKERETQLSRLLEYLVLNDKFPDFLTEPAYEVLLTQRESEGRKEENYAENRYAARLGNF